MVKLIEKFKLMKLLIFLKSNTIKLLKKPLAWAFHSSQKFNSEKSLITCNLMAELNKILINEAASQCLTASLLQMSG